MNGQPYVGRPRSPNPRDIEFDAMLRQSESTTKLSLSAEKPGRKGKDNRPTSSNDDNHTNLKLSLPRIPLSRPKTTEGNLDRSASSQPAPNTKVISAPLFVPPRNESTNYAVVPPPLTATNGQQSAGITKINSNSSSGHTVTAAPPTPSKTVPPPLNRFRVGNRAKHMPAEWDSSIEYEARTESDSSSAGELSPRPDVPPKSILGRNHQTGQAGRKPKDDAWVDIVLLEHDKNGAQRPPAAKASNDPDKAQAEILRAVQGGPPPEDLPSTPGFDDDEVLRPRGRHANGGTGAGDSSGNRAEGVNSSREPIASPSPLDSPPRVSPRGPRGPTSPQQIQQRNVSPTSPTKTPPLASPSPGKGGAGISSLIQIYQNKDAAAAASIPPALATPRYAGLPSSPAPSRIPVSINTQSPLPAAIVKAPEELSATSTTPTVTFPTTDTTPQKRTAALPAVAETQHAQPQAQYPASSLVQSSSLPESQSTSSYQSPGSNLTSDDASDSSFEPFNPPAPIPLEPMRVPSPGRYIHGAPLTNVIEDEEEEV